MSQQQKSAYWKALKASGAVFDKHYREYSTEQLAGMYAEITGMYAEITSDSAPPATEQPTPAPTPAQASAPIPASDPGYQEYQEFMAWKAQQSDPRIQQQIKEDPTNMAEHLPRANRGKVDEMPGERLNTKTEDEPIRVDDAGRVWYQEEVRKAGYAKPRGRRVLKYMNPGVETKEVKNGDYVESFEIGGKKEVPSEVKITLPSYQVGIYQDPRLPFKVNVYNSQQGFDLLEVQEFYGGAELVPTEIKRIYVSHVLCYDIRTTIRAIQTEFRHQQLTNQNGL